MCSVPKKTDVLAAVIALALVTVGAGQVHAQAKKADFNGDTYGDLAIGAPGENAGATGSGAVHILYGTNFGLHPWGNQILYAFNNDAPATSYLGDFGASMAWGNFDGDEFTDLAVGMPGFALAGDGWGNRGAVRVYYGKKYGGLVDAYTQFFMGEDEEDFFGTALAVGRFNDDQYQDLAIGIPQGVPSDGTTDGAGGGQILVIYGGPDGLNMAGADRRSQESAGIPGETEHLDAFGFSLAAANFGAGPEDDLAIGVPGENNNEGAVNVIYGSPVGLDLVNAQLFRQGANGLAGGREAGDQFGFSLAAGDFNLNGYADLAIGSPGEDVGTFLNAGYVHVVYGGSSGLDSYSSQAFGQDRGDFDLRGNAGTLHSFGFSLAAGDFGKDSSADLAVGVPGDGNSGKAKGGAVNVIYGGFFIRLSATGNQFWAQTDAGSGDLFGGTENGDRFGYSLAAIDVGGGSRADLIVGVPGESIGTQAQAGGIHVIFSTAAGLTAQSSQFWGQDSSVSGIEIQSTAETGDRFGYSVGGAAADQGNPLWLP